MSRISIPTGGAQLLSQIANSQQQAGLGALTSILNNRTENIVRSGQLIAELLEREKERQLQATQFNARLQQEEQNRIAQAFLQGQSLAAQDISQQRSENAAQKRFEATSAAEENRFSRGLEQRQQENIIQQRENVLDRELRQAELISRQRESSLGREQQQKQFEAEQKLNLAKTFEPFLLDYIQNDPSIPDDLKEKSVKFITDEFESRQQKLDAQKIENRIKGIVGNALKSAEADFSANPDLLQEIIAGQFNISTPKQREKSDLDLQNIKAEMERRKTAAENEAEDRRRFEETYRRQQAAREQLPEQDRIEFDLTGKVREDRQTSKERTNEDVAKDLKKYNPALAGAFENNIVDTTDQSLAREYLKIDAALEGTKIEDPKLEKLITDKVYRAKELDSLQESGKNPFEVLLSIIEKRLQPEDVLKYKGTLKKIFYEYPDEIDKIVQLKDTQLHGRERAAKYYREVIKKQMSRS